MREEAWIAAYVEMPFRPLLDVIPTRVAFQWFFPGCLRKQE